MIELKRQMKRMNRRRHAKGRGKEKAKSSGKKVKDLKVGKSVKEKKPKKSKRRNKDLKKTDDSVLNPLADASMLDESIVIPKPVASKNEVKKDEDRNRLPPLKMMSISDKKKQEKDIAKAESLEEEKKKKDIAKAERLEEEKKMATEVEIKEEKLEEPSKSETVEKNPKI